VLAKLARWTVSSVSITVHGSVMSSPDICHASAVHEVLHARCDCVSRAHGALEALGDAAPQAWVELTFHRVHPCIAWSLGSSQEVASFAVNRTQYQRIRICYACDPPMEHSRTRFSIASNSILCLQHATYLVSYVSNDIARE
jgi:hypothetical protein